jgi:hypothetical protein
MERESDDPASPCAGDNKLWILLPSPARLYSELLNYVRTHLCPELYTLQTEYKSELLYDWRFTANRFFLATSLLRLSNNIFLSEFLLS